MDWVFLEMVDIDHLLPSHLAFVETTGQQAHAPSRILNFNEDMWPFRTQCVLMTSYGTMQTIVNNHPNVFEVHKKLDSQQTVLKVKSFLTSKTDRGGSSWLSQFTRFLNVPAKLALEDMWLSEWLTLTPLVKTTFLWGPRSLDWQGGYHTVLVSAGGGSAHQGQGKLAQRQRLHNQLGPCVKWRTAPLKWSAKFIAGPSSKGHDRHYIDGSALVWEQQSSKHAMVKIAKDLQDPLVSNDTKVALVSCKGTITLLTDSVRKYSDGEYKYGHNQPALKSGRNKKEQPADKL
jgi:hypothetical protein